MTSATTVSVATFISSIQNEKHRALCAELDTLLARAAGVKGKLWGKNIVGYGDYHYRYQSGREADWFCFGFSPRKDAVSLYVTARLDPKDKAAIGAIREGTGCLHLRSIDDAQRKALLAVLKKVAAKLKAHPNSNPYEL